MKKSSKGWQIEDEMQGEILGWKHHALTAVSTRSCSTQASSQVFLGILNKTVPSLHQFPPQTSRNA